MPLDRHAMPATSRQRDRLFVSLILLIHFLLLLPGFISPGRKVLCLGMNDVATQFSHWRAFAAGAWRAGEIPLWSPLTYCGQALLGNFQSAALYPLNAHYLFLPLHIGLNLEFFLHLALFALGVFALARRWGVSPAGSFLAAMTASFGGPHFQVVFVGHLTIVTTLAWMPILLLALHHIALGAHRSFVAGGTRSAVDAGINSRNEDRETRESAAADSATTNGGWGWTLAGAAALAMQVLAGHPQMVYYTLLTGGLYFIVVLALRRRWVEADDSKANVEDVRTWTPALLVALAQGVIVVALGFGLSAFQMAAGLAALGDIERGAGYTMAASRNFSPPPETLLTILFPDIIGNELQVPYWGRHRYLNFFLGVIPLALAVIGFARGGRAQRRTAIAMTAILFLIMIAGLTPLFPILFHGLPGYRLFRGYARWAMFWSVFVALGAGMGYDVLRAGLAEAGQRAGAGVQPAARLPVRLLAGMAGLGFALAAGALAARLLSGPGSALGGAWERWFADFHSDPSQFLPQALFRLTPESAGDALRMALRSITLAGLTLLAAGGLPLLALRMPPERRARVAALLLALGVAEGIIYASRFVDFTPSSEFRLPAAVEEVVAAHVEPPDRCILFAIGFENLLMPLGISSPGGYDQFVPRRMGAFLGRSQREFDAPTYAGMRALSLSNYHPRMRLLRVSHVLQVYTLPERPGELVYQGELLNLFRAPEPPLPEAFLVEQWREAEGLDAALDAVFAPDFDPAAEAVVEGAPAFPPGPVAASVQPLDAPFVRVTKRGVNFIEVEAWTPREAMLIVTNGHMRGWRARAAGDGLLRYDLLPANGALMGVGLGPGAHSVRLFYWPRWLTWGVWINVISLAMFAAGVVVVILRRRAHSKCDIANP